MTLPPTSPSLRGSGLKLIIPYLVVLCKCRLPLYEGVDWNVLIAPIRHIIRVSLFTREWIEIRVSSGIQNRFKSPSLRGSGLKSPTGQGTRWERWSPSLRGSGLKCQPYRQGSCCHWVSLFTREWIEIAISVFVWLIIPRLPLYEGVDWNDRPSTTLYPFHWSPSLRGSGLKCTCCRAFQSKQGLPLYEGVDWNINSIYTSLFHNVSLFTREWIEITDYLRYNGTYWSPSLRGSGLK